MGKFLKISNLQGNYFVKNFSLDVSTFPTILPKGEYIHLLYFKTKINKNDYDRIGIWKFYAKIE